MTGKVYLVGAGPGDPELITVKGRRLIESAGAVLYDRLANPALLSLAPPGAERVYVGKKRSEHAYTQEEIIELMIDARATWIERRSSQGRRSVHLRPRRRRDRGFGRGRHRV